MKAEQLALRGRAKQGNALITHWYAVRAALEQQPRVALPRLPAGNTLFSFHTFPCCSMFSQQTPSQNKHLEGVILFDYLCHFPAKSRDIRACFAC